MCLIRGTNSKFPCPICLAPLEELSELSKTFPTRTADQAKDALAHYRRNNAEGEVILKSLGLRPVEVNSHLILATQVVISLKQTTECFPQGCTLRPRRSGKL